MEIRRIRIKGVKRIIIPQMAQAGGDTSSIVIKGKSGRKWKKRSKSTKLFEKLTRRSARAQRSVFDHYLARHDRSNRKKKDGWLKDWSNNVFRASRKGRKRFKLSTLF